MINSTCVVGIALALAACSDNGGKSSIPLDDFVDEIRSAECDFEVRCEAVPDKATCLEALPFDTTEVLTTIADAKAGLVHYDDKAAARCVNSFEKLGCSFGDLTAAVDPCRDMFSGSVAAGGACVIDAECADRANCEATDTTCDPSTACCAGTCGAARLDVPIGGACTGSMCVSGAFCDIPSGASSGTCTAQLSTEGAACDALDACKAPLQCALGAASGTCTKLPAEGEACDGQSFLACDDLRDYCDPVTLTCAHRVDVGADCTDATCAGFAGCDATTKKCVSRPSLGDACDDGPGGSCLGSLHCVDGTCTAGAAGMDCSSSQ